MKRKLYRIIAFILALIIGLNSINIPEASAAVKKGTYITVSKNVYYVTKTPSDDSIGEVILMKWGASGTKVSVKEKIIYKKKTYQVVGIAGTYNGKKKADSVFKPSVKKVTLPKSIKLIGKNTFNGCKKLTSLTIPASVTKIEKKAINNCPKLKKIVLKSRDIDLPSSGAFTKIHKKAVIYIPTGLKIKDSYKSKVKKQLMAGGQVKYNLSKPQVKAIEDGELLENKSVQKDKFTLKGVVFSNSKIKKVTYQITDEEGKKIKSGNCDGTTSWKLSCDLQKGTNAIKITAVDEKDKKGSTKVYVVRVDEEVTYSEAVKAEKPENSEKIAESITNIEEKGDSIYITVENNSELITYVENGTLKKGDIYLLQDSEEMPMGFVGIYEGMKEENGTQVVQFTPATMEDIYPDEVTIDLSGGIDTENPIAYAYFPDGTEISMKSESSVVLPSSLETEKETEMREHFKITETKKNGKTTLEIEFEDVILYDEDKDKETENDQLRLNGKYEIKDFLTDFYFDKDFLSIKQCYNKTSYSEDADIEFEVGAKLDTEEVVEFLNGGFDNKKTYGMLKMEGIDLSDSIMLGVVGINIATMTPVVTSFQSLQKTSEKTPLMPVVFLSFILHLDGEISVEVRVGFNESSYNVKGFNLQKKNYIGKYGAFDKSLGESKTLFGYNFQTINCTGKSKTDMSSPAEQKLYVEGEGKAEIEIGAGVLGAIMLNGIIPAGFSAYPYFKAEGEIKGRLALILPMEGYEATGEYYIKEEFGVSGKVAFALTEKIRTSQKYTVVLWEKFLQGKEEDDDEVADEVNDTSDSEETDANNDNTENDTEQTTGQEISVNPRDIPFVIHAGETYTFISEGNYGGASVWGFNLGDCEPSIVEVINLDRNGAVLSQDMYVGNYINLAKIRWNYDNDDASGKVIIKVYYGSAKIFGFSAANLKQGITATLKTGGETMDNPLSINKEKVSLKKGNTFTLKATSKNELYTLKDVEFISDNYKIAYVNEDGKIEARKKGKTKITVKGNGGFTKECIVIVN